MFSPDKYYTNQELVQLSGIKQESFDRMMKELFFFESDTPYRECVEYTKYYSQNSFSNFDSIIDALNIDVVKYFEPPFNPFNPPSNNNYFLATFENTCRKDFCVPYHFIYEGQSRPIIKFTMENYFYLKDHILGKGSWLIPEDYQNNCMDNYAIEETMNCFIDDRFVFGQSLAKSKLCFISKVFNKIEEIFTKRYNIRYCDMTEKLFYRPIENMI